MYSAAGALITRWVALVAVLALSSMAQERSQARSMVITPLGITATSQTLASQAGAQILAAGGSAMDAAIAANAVLGVVEPMSCGMGGDLFAIHWDAKTGKLTGINASGWSPAGLTREALRQKGYSSMPQEDIHSVTVPGCVAGWQALHKKFGKLPWRTLFEPAIYFASNGFPVTEIIHDHWTNSAAKLGKVKGNDLFLPGGRAPDIGDIFQNEPLAAAYRLIAQKGPAAFYEGAIGDALLATSRKLGGTLAKADLADYEPEWVEPISTTYRGWTVYELPPNGQGIAALQMLNIMEKFPIPSLDPKGSEALHLKIEAQKLAYQDLKRYIGDPASSEMPVAGLLSKEYAEQRASAINAKRAASTTKPGDPWKHGGDTIYLSVVDRDGNIVSLIQSIYLSFGSAIPVEGMGFHLQNRGGLFEFEEKHPNVIGPRKRPLHTIIPGFMQKGSIHVGFGIMGGFNQAQAHAQFVSNLVDHDLNIQGGLEAPRFTKLTFGGSDVMIEGRYPKSTIDALRDLGHIVEVRGDYYGQMGGGQAVMHDSEKKMNYGASSPRKDGAAIPEPAPYLKSARKK